MTGGEPGPASTAGAIAARAEAGSPKRPEAGVINAPKGDSPVAIRKPLSMTPAETVAHLTGLQTEHDTVGPAKDVLSASPESGDGAKTSDIQAASGEQGAPTAVDTAAIAAVTRELGGQKPKMEAQRPDPDIVVPSDVLKRDPDFNKKVEAAQAAAAAKGEKITANQAKTVLLNEHYQAWAKDQSNIPNFLRLVLTEGSFRKALKDANTQINSARQMGETVAGSAVEMALAEWRQGKDKALDEQRKKGGPTGVIGFIYRILNKFFNKFVKGVALFTFQTAEHDIVPGLKGPQQR